MNGQTPGKGTADGGAVPFDTAKLDALLDKAGLDALIVSSQHNIRYLLGGYRFFFFAHADAIGIGRYVPLLVYQRGHVDKTCYIGIGTEQSERELGALWAPHFVEAWYGDGAMNAAVRHLKSLGLDRAHIGIETAFLGADAERALRASLPHTTLVDALVPLERFRAVKSPRELEYLRDASDKVVDAMMSVMSGHKPGCSTAALTEAMRREEVLRGMEFDYCLIAAGNSHIRAPTEKLFWREGDVLSLDSGGSYKGYIGDLARMAIFGEPDAELEDLLGEIDEIQMASRKPIRAGAIGTEIFEAAEAVIRRSSHANALDFVAHGMGLISHEAPRLTSHGPIPYPGDHGPEPLEAGMVLSIETTHPHRRGYIKLEDTVVVTANGWEAFGDRGRDWNRGGTTA
ncbi:aminopeptidase P family protein [Mesorhizobium sp. B3-1-6]|uniref:M24 family metallopeptidase n=1 Tax=Mesorhizobium sp. B3-1-6 TaxID=2589895 RepID=UPI001128244B|nr:Xaa-Pro peptidase family protein [Mesorhizobium sp. B3-1-6]TPI41357.1 aminopeptidase P family protein [Mesorhizobium sp. B3-1-6]